MTDSGPPDVLKRFLSPRETRRAGEACEFCEEPVAEVHKHVVDVQRRGILCACRACALLFDREGAAGGYYRTVPDRYLALGPEALSEEQWDAMGIPVGIAFLFYSTPAGKVVTFYPGPAGATESLLGVETWNDLVRANPPLKGLAADVEALLVLRRAGGGECFVVPIDVCYELVGRLKRCWKGFDGGEDAHREIDTFFASVRERSGA